MGRCKHAQALPSTLCRYDEDEDPYIRTTDPSPNQSVGCSLAYLVSAPPFQFKTCREILQRLQHRSVPPAR